MIPKWHKISTIKLVKTEACSYGVMFLEIIFCSSNMEINVSKPNEVLLPILVYKLLITRKLDRLDLDEDVDW